MSKKVCELCGTYYEGEHCRQYHDLRPVKVPKVWSWNKDVPDKLNLQCDAVFDALENVEPAERIGVLEQCIEYVRLDLAQIEEERRQDEAQDNGNT